MSNPQKKTLFNWSSGKDSALALHYLLEDPSVELSHLLTTINEHHQRVTMHGTPVELLKKQLEAIDLPYSFVRLPENPSMEEYESLLANRLKELKNEGFAFAAYGDIFLEDLKQYRDQQLSKLGLETIFPLWEKDTKELLEEFIDKGFRAVIVSANEELGERFLGRELDDSFIKDLPDSIDPCGENGEFHTFCFDGPIFSKAVHFEFGEKVKKSYPNPAGDGEVAFWFQDLVPISSSEINNGV